MRETFFRGISLKTDEWIYGSYLVDGKDHFIQSDEKWQFTAIEPKTVGQYTGLRDKNGVRIYEGDIVRVKYWSSTGEPCPNCGHSEDGSANMPVEFDKGMFGLRSKEFDDLVEIEGKQDYRIIGNIYQNPELLK